MARRSPCRAALALAFLCVVISNGQANDSCRSGCRGASKTFKYQEGTTYKYNFDSKVLVSLSSAEGQQSSTEVKATVLITQQGDCNQVLRLQNVQVIGNDGKKHSNLPDIDKPIRINYHDGHLEDSICITPGDSQNSLNVKRAVASLLQANLKSGHETDVFGVCPTDINQRKEGNVVIVEKSRNLNRCAYRESVNQDFLATVFNTNSEIKSSPILSGDYRSTSRIKNGVLEQVSVTEKYLYVPFSVGQNGAKATVETTLKYVGTGKDNAQVKSGQARSIILEDPHPVNSPQANVNTILAAVKQVAKTVEVTVGENTAKEFASLVRILRVSKKDDLLAVYNQVRAGVGFSDKVGAKKLFLDALLRAGNGDNLEVAIELLRNKELTECEQNLVYLGLSTVRHATEASLASGVSLLSQPNTPRAAFLGVGNLAGRYCRQHDCSNVDAVNKLTQKLVQKLGSGKATNRQEENDIVFALKALGNIRHLNDNVLSKIIGIAQDKKAANRLRATALETYLSDPCKDKLRDSALTILKDVQQDSEIRIRAYLALAECPNNKVGNAIKGLLENEPSYQVGGFIVSHIRNLRASANPDKEPAKQHLGLINVPKRFPLDLRRYSANTELSYTIDSLGIANSIESNVIYSQNSFLPRSTSLNLTAEIFGHNINFLEVAARQENLDRLVEHYLGPRGLLRSKSLQELWDKEGKPAKEVVEELRGRLEKALRARRDVSKADIAHVTKQVQIKTNELNNDLDLDLSVRAFGAELLFLNINDDVKRFTPDALIDKIVEQFDKGVDQLKNFEETLRANLLFLDTEFSYPTTSGFPLRLGVEGSSNLQLKTSGAIDLKSLLNSEGKFKLSLIPSANIELTGRLTIDAQILESGLKVVSTLHTATGGDLVLDLKKNSVEAKFSLPVEKQNLLSATHDIVFYTREGGVSEVDTPLKFAQNKDFSICLDQLSPFIGLTFCGEFTGPNIQGGEVPILPFPLSGDAKIAATIEREDLSHFLYKEVFHSTQNKLGAEVLAEAIGANGQKKVSLAIEVLLTPEQFIRASLVSPVANGLFEGRIITTNKEKSLSLKLVQDNNEYLGKIGVEIEGTPARAVYKPIVQYKTPQDSALQVPPYKVEGQVIAETRQDGVTYTLDKIRVVIPDVKTITINGKIGTEPETVFTDLTLTEGSNSASLKGKLRVNPNLLKYNAEFKNTLGPEGNLHLKGELTRDGEEVKNFFQVAHGGDFSNKNNILTLENSLKYRNRGPQDFQLETKNSLKYPAQGTDVKLEFELKPNAIEYNVDIQYNNVKIGSELDWEHNSKRDGTDFELKFGLWGLNNRLSLKSKRTVTGDLSQVENSLEFNDKRAEATGKIKHHIKPQDVDVAADLLVKVPTYNTPFNVVSGLRINSNEIDLSHKVSSANTVYADIFLKANRAGNANGSIKITLRDQLVVSGQIKANRGSGNGEILIELPGLQRSSKVDATFTIQAPTHNLLINIYPLFNSDKTKKITLSTQTSLTEHSFDSKNNLNVFGEKLEVNAKGSQQGEITNGKTNGEVTITLPNQHYVAAKLNRDFKNNNGVLNGNGVVTLEHRSNKNQPGDKLTIKGEVKNTKAQESLIDLAYQITAERGNGRNINLDLGVKTRLEGARRFLNLASKLYGSDLPSPLESSFKGDCDGIVGSFSTSSSYAPLGKLSASGKHDLTGNGKPVSGELNLEIDSSSKSLKTVKLGLGGSVQKGELASAKAEGKIFVESSESVLIDVEASGEGKLSDKESRIKTSVKCSKAKPVSLDAGIKRVENKGHVEILSDASLIYGEHQKIAGNVNLQKVAPHEYKIDAKLDTPVENFKNNKLQVHTKRSEDGSRYQNELVVTNDGKTWTSNTDIVLSETTPSIEIKAKCPEGQLRHILVKITKLSERQLAGQLKLVNQKHNFLLEATIDADVESIDNFHVKATANSPSLKIDKYLIEANNKPAKTGRRIQVSAKSGNKNILTGSTSYTSREEQGKLIVEGSGSFKVNEQTKSANFKYIRQNLSQAKNGETGLEISFDAGLGNQAIDAELKVTNKQFRLLNSYCEEKKQCAHVEVDVKTLADDVNTFNQEIEIAIDLRKLGLSHEFGLKAVTQRKEYVLDHTIDIHIQSQDNSKYQYSLYIHPKKAGVSLTTPKRIVSLEANVNCPKNLLQEGGRITSEILFYLDKKNNPNQKSGIISFLDVNLKKQSFAGEVKLTNPALRRPLLIGLQSTVTPLSLDALLTADVFAQPDQKLIVSVKSTWSDLKDWRNFEEKDRIEIRSSGLGLEILYNDWTKISLASNEYGVGTTLKYKGLKSVYESEASFGLDPKNLVSVLTVLNIPVYKLTSQLQLSENQQILDSNLVLYAGKPIKSHLEIKNLNTLKLILTCEEKPQDKLIITSGFIPSQIADFRAEIVSNGAKQELGHVTVKLDEANFLKSDYDVKSKEIKELVLQPIRKKVEDSGEELKKLYSVSTTNLKDELQHLGENLKKAPPNLAPVSKYYVDELEKIRAEILADKSIKEASELLYNILSAVSQTVSGVVTNLSNLVESVSNTIRASLSKVLESFEKDLLPQAKDLGEALLSVGVEITDRIVVLVLTLGAKAAEIAEEYKPELQQLATVAGEVTQDILKALVNVYEAVRTVLTDQWQQVYNEIKSLPIVEQLKGEYEKLGQNGILQPEALANTLKDLLSTLKDLAPSNELKELVQAISDYVTAKLTNQKVDDKGAIDRIIKAGASSVKQIVAAIAQEGRAPELNVPVPVPGNIWSKLPRLAAVKLSPVSYLLGEDVTAPLDLLLTLVNTPRNWVPPFPLYGLVAQGQHIFTFDGKHLTFPGKCNYVLAHDALDRNFTVIGSYKAGLLEAISLTQGADTITLQLHGKVLLNNAPTELPVRRQHVAAYRNTERIVLASDYGVKVICGPELLVCAVTVSGFYHGKLRGLLGNGNNEPYDDFTIPSGKIVTGEGEFGNSYKTSAACPPVVTVPHHGHHSTPSCDKLFGWESRLRVCYPFVKNDNFKTACEHGVAAGVKDTENAIAVAYVAACNRRNIPLRVPEEFVKCTNGPKPLNIGDDTTVTTPGKAADIVVLVDTSKENEETYKEYAQPLIQQLTGDLQAKGITDVEFHLIAYGGENQWPSHITTGGGKLTFKGKAPALKFADAPKENTLVTGCAQLDALLELVRGLCADVKLALGLDLRARTYGEGLDYPFRANAIKTVIAVTGKPCEVGRLFPLQVLRTLLYRDKTISLNLITPINRQGAKADAKHIVGFNNRDVWALGPLKNRLTQYSDLGKELTYQDYCITFAIHNDGNVFLADNVLLQAKAQRKQFVQVTSNGIVEQLLGADKTYECECSYTTPFTARNVCKLVKSKERPQTKKASTKS